MAKSKKEPRIYSMTELAREAKKSMQEEIANDRVIEIISANIKDDFCLYSYEIKSGRHAGFLHKVNKAPGIISDDLRNAFAALCVFLAHIDDVFKHSGIEVEDILKFKNHELTQLYSVLGIKLFGDEESGSVELSGKKYLSIGARADLDTPKVSIDDLSSYNWHNELREAVHKCKEEVALYHYGKFTPIQEEEEDQEVDPKQSKIEFGKGKANISSKEVAVEAEVDLEIGKV